MYLQHYELKQDEDSWAFEEINTIVRRDSEAGWRVTQVVINGANSDETVAYVAAGPLEDLLDCHGWLSLTRSLSLLSTTSGLQLALSHVWLNQSSPVWGAMA